MRERAGNYTLAATSTVVFSFNVRPGDIVESVDLDVTTVSGTRTIEIGLSRVKISSSGEFDSLVELWQSTGINIGASGVSVRRYFLWEVVKERPYLCVRLATLAASSLVGSLWVSVRPALARGGRGIGQSS